MFGGGDASGGFSSGPGSDRMATCRVCSQKFASFPELKQHIREENHHDINMTKPITTNTTLNPSASSFVPGNITNNNNLSMNPFSSNMPRKASFDKSLTDSSISYNNKSPEMNPFSSGFSSMAPRDKNIVNTQLLSWASAGSTSQDFSMKVNPFAPQNSSTINNNNNNNNPFVKSILKTGYDDQKGENRHVNFKLNSTPDKFTSNNMTMNPSANPSFNLFANLNPNPIVSPAVPSSDASWKRQGTPAHGAIMKPQVQSMQMGHNDGNPFDTTAPAVNHAPRVKLKGKIKTNTTTVPAANTTTNNISAEAPPGLSSGKKLSRKDANASGGSEKWICRHCDIQCATSDEFEAHSRR